MISLDFSTSFTYLCKSLKHPWNNDPSINLKNHPGLLLTKRMKGKKERRKNTDTVGWMDERCFRPLFCTVKAELGRGQPGLMRWIWEKKNVYESNLHLPALYFFNLSQHLNSTLWKDKKKKRRKKKRKSWHRKSQTSPHLWNYQHLCSIYITLQLHAPQSLNQPFNRASQ